MSHRPSGPRQKQAPLASANAAPSGSSRTQPTRDQAFSEIFGRRNTHHVNSQPQAAQQPLQQAGYGAYPSASISSAAPSGGGAYGAYTGYPAQQQPAQAYPRQEGRYDQFAQSAGVGLPPGVVPPAVGASAGGPGWNGYANYGQPAPLGPRAPHQAFPQPSYPGPGAQASLYPNPADSRSRRTSLNPAAANGPGAPPSGYPHAGPPPNQIPPLSHAGQGLHPQAVPPGASVQRRPTQGSLRSFVSTSDAGGWTEPSLYPAPPLPTPPQGGGYQQGYPGYSQPPSRNGSLSSTTALVGGSGPNSLTPAQEYQAQVAPRPTSPSPSMGGVPSAAQPPSYSPVPSAAGRPFPSASPSSFATSRAQSQAQSGTSRSSTPLSLPAFESFGDGSLEGFDWRRKSDDLGGSIKETDEGLDTGTGGGLGGLITPKPGMDDSELGYLAAGGGANGQDGASEREPRNRVQSGASSVYSVDNYYSTSSSRYSRANSIKSHHTRTPSESSSRSVGGYGPGSQGGFAPLARIDTSSSYYQSDNRSLASPSSGVIDFPQHRQSTGRDSVDSALSNPNAFGGSGGYHSPAQGQYAYNNRSTSFSSQHSSRDAAVASLRRGPGSIRSLGGGSGGGPNFPPPSSFNFPSPGGSVKTTGGSIARPARKSVRIYPAMLSRVAEAFRSGLTLSERVKDGLAYKDAFDGREAVDLLCSLLDTDNRNLALLLGRALDFQKFFHDVTYDHRLRDSTNELYQFKRKVILPNAPFAAALGSEFADGAAGTPPGIEGQSEEATNDGSLPNLLANSSLSAPLNRTPSVFTTSENERSSISSLPTGSGGAAGSLPTSPGSVDQSQLQLQQQQAAQETDDLPSGVFTLLSVCYSPTCSSTSLCYSISCPLRIEQAKKLNMKPQPGLRKVASAESLKEDEGEDGGGAALWANSVSKAVLDGVDAEERKRQEAINELIFTERDFVKDMEYLRDFWVKPLRTNDVIQPPERREVFATQVFWNVSTILANNSSLSDLLTKRQRSQPVVESVGDIFLEKVPHFQPFVDYGGHQAYGKHEFEKEKLDNPDFVKFVDEVERKPESRKIELNGFLTKPTTRLGRYPLLLKAILKLTPEDNPDAKWIPQVIELLNGWLDKVNTAAGKTQSRMDLVQLDSQLRRAESQELRLDDDNRELIHKGQLKRRGGTQSESADLEVYLLDNVLVLARYKAISKTESELRLYKRPIPLELLTMVTPDEQYNLTKYGIRPKALLNRTATGKSGTSTLANPKPEKEGKHGYSITFHYLGRRGYTLTLWHESHVQRKKWLETIDKQQQLVRERNRKIELHPLEPSIVGPFKVNCAVPYMGGDKIIYGTDDGVYFSNLAEPDKKPALVVSLLDVTQVEVLEHPFPLLIVLAERSVQTFPLESLSLQDPTAALKRGKRISSHTTFFKAGLCVGRQLVCIVKSSPLSTTIKTMDPVEAPANKKQQGAAFSKLKPNRNETLRVFKEFYIPTESSSIHFLKTKLCVGCTKGFEIVDLETLDTQGLLDPADPNLDLVHKRDNQRPVRPIAIYRVEGDFLLCYDEFAFYVDKNGWRVGGPRNRKDVRWKLTWEGSPTNFALHYPWVLAFDSNFVEIWNVNTGVFTQVIQGSNIRLLFADTPPSTAHSAASLHQQQMAQQQRMFRPPPPQMGGNYYPPYPPQNGYGQHPPPPGQRMMRPPPPPGQPPMGYHPPPQQQMRLPPPPPRNARSKIVFSVDEKVVEVRLAAH